MQYVLTPFALPLVHKKCYNYHDLVNIYEIHENVGSESTFNTICPALVEQIISKSCDIKPAKRSYNQSAIGKIYTKTNKQTNKHKYKNRNIQNI